MRLYNGVRLLDRPSAANVHRLDMGALPMIHEMHRRGIYLDVGTLTDLGTELRDSASSLRQQIAEWSGPGFDAGSPDQVAELLFKKLDLDPPPTAKLTGTGKRVSVDDDCLAAMKDDHPVVDLIRDLRAITKLDSTYVVPLPLLRDAGGRIHPTFRTTVARTGRLSSETPNCQNIPIRTELGSRVREAFQSDPGLGKETVLASIDLSQIEMVMAAHLSQDPNMMEVFCHRQDIHLKTVCGVYGYEYDALEQRWKKYKAGEAEGEELAELRRIDLQERMPLKNVGFGVLFGQTAPGLQTNIITNGGPLIPLAQCDQYIEQWFGLYEMVREWMEQQYRRARRYGMTWDIFGRHRFIPGAKSALRRIVNRALREAGNQPIQSGAQGIIKLAMAAIMEAVELYQSLGKICWPLLQIHDELIFELEKDIADEFLALARWTMETVVPLSVPVRASASMGRTWKELK